MLRMEKKHDNFTTRQKPAMQIEVFLCLCMGAANTYLCMGVREFKKNAENNRRKQTMMPNCAILQTYKKPNMGTQIRS